MSKTGGKWQANYGIINSIDNYIAICMFLNNF